MRYFKDGKQGQNWYLEGSDVEQRRYTEYRKANRRTAENMYQIKEKPRVLHLIVEPTNRCNLECPHCNRSVMTRPIRDLDFDLFKLAIDDAAKELIHSVSLYALGESMLHPRICDMIEYIKAKGIPYSDLSTNATMDLSKLAQSSLSEIIISMDGFKETFEKMRYPAKYEKVLANVTKFLKLSKRPIVRIQCIDTEETRKRKNEFIGHWLAVGADVVYWKMLEGMTQNLGDKLVDKEEIKERLKQRVPCKQLFYTLTLQADGNWSYCCHSPKGRAVLGNVKEISLKDAWGKLNLIRESHKQGFYTEICKDCIDFFLW